MQVWVYNVSITRRSNDGIVLILLYCLCGLFCLDRVHFHTFNNNIIPCRRSDSLHFIADRYGIVQSCSLVGQVELTAHGFGERRSLMYTKPEQRSRYVPTQHCAWIQHKSSRNRSAAVVTGYTRYIVNHKEIVLACVRWSLLLACPGQCF